MSKIEITCCDGVEKYPGICLKDGCPNYRKAREQVDSSWPYVGTGYGNLYGNPSISHYLAQVRKNIANDQKDNEKKSE
ncbi:MAG: hypothetical protein UT39_C0001G0079 [Candidatus Woesebacteria bacterium GW2011_GWA1_39_21]|uniref:Uncharacterized protein n=1 Tax=Candidatus Woesebacteria bacterium GW2011_GWA1_39_21 TaxID=1618550 RepID=A0A0G0N774_9BACT|nr:MAG: hypothetical protein UT39_C0001G0079 [Candidatus Woesebacteria bacterium GW2011_GWA1_39_21]